MAELRRVLLAALPLLCLLALVAAPGGADGKPRAAADRAGTIAVEIAPAARKKLRRQSLSIRPAGATKGGPRRLRIPVTGGEAGGVAELDLRGAVRLTSTAGKRKRSARARLVRAVVSADRTYVSAEIAGERVTLFVLDRPGGTPFDPLTGDVRIDRSPVRFANFTRDVLRERLRAPRLRSKLGHARVSAAVAPAPTESASPPVRTRPATAIDITTGELTWRVRESWVDYLHDAPGEQGGTRSSNGAEDVAPAGGDQHVYAFTFPFESGWYDPVSGTANVEFSGTVTFFKLIAPFFIDLDASDPEIELGGPAPRAIMRMDGRRNNADQVNRRAVVVDLEQDDPPTKTTGADTTTCTYQDVDGLNPAGPTAWPVAGYYLPGDEFGKVTVSYTVPGDCG